MADTITVKFKVMEDGSLKQVASDSNKASKGLDKTAKSARTADRNLKGAAQASSNTTKNFSKMAQGTGGLVAAYATLAANIFAISAAYNFLKNAGDLRVLQESQFNYAKTTGKSLDLLTSKVQQATGGLLAFEEAAQAVSIGTAAGLNGAQIEGLASVAKKASMALGRDLTDSFNRLTRGAIKAEPELLDELGIIIRLDKVTKDYARTLNKAAKDLTTFQKTQAVVNAVLEQGETKFADLGGEVNQIAKLGKSFNDVLLFIKETIGPLAEFIGGALSNNIFALAGAFAFLGTGITKTLGGVGPSMIDLSEDAAASRARLQQSAGGSVVGQRLASGEALSDKDLNYIESSARAKSSTIIKYDTISKDAVVRNVRIMKAERQLQLASTEVGVKRTYALWRAELKLLQAQHGTTMGFMKAGMRGFGRVANSVLGAAGAIGLLFTAIGLVKQLVESFKSDEMKAFLENTEALNDRLEEQLRKSKLVTDNLVEQKNLADGVLQAFQASSNITFGNLDGFSFKRMDDGFDSEIKKRNIEARDVVRNLAANIEQQIKTLKESGLDTTKLEKNLAALEKASEDISAAGINPTKSGRGNIEKYNSVIEILNANVREVNQSNKESIAPLDKQNTALLGLVQTGDELIQIQDKLGQAQSKYSNSLKILQDFKTGLQESGLNIFGDLNEAQQKSIQGLFTEELDKTLNLSELILNLESRRLTILEIERDVLLNQTKLQTKYVKLLKGATPLQIQKFNRDKKVEETEAAINKLLGERTIIEVMNADLSDTKGKQDKENLLNLQAQLEVAKRLTLESAQLMDGFNKGLESGLTTNIGDLIKGNETSIKDAMLKIAKSAIESTVDVLVKQMVLKIMNNDPALKIKSALESGGDYVKEKIEQAFNNSFGSRNTPAPIVEGKPLPGLNPSDSSNSSSSTSKGFSFMDYLFGKKGKGTKITTGSARYKGVDFSEEGVASKSGGREGGIFGDFIASIQDLFSGASPFLEGLKNIFKGGLDGFGSLFKDIFGGLFGGSKGDGGFVSTVLGAFGFGARSGGVFSGGKKMQGYASGGIARGSTSGYPAVLHGTEAVVPLPHGGKIPVEMKEGGATNNNIVVNVSTDGTTSTQGSTGPDMDKMGGAIAAAVQAELQNQKRSGGILNPYGAA